MPPRSLAELVDPAHCAVVTSEVQRGVVGERSALPELAAAAGPIIERLAVLCGAARAAGVRVIHATAARRADAAGSNTNARLFAAVQTLVVTGVSVNVAVTNLVMDAVNHGYQVVVPRDAVCGIPQSYADAVLDGTISLLATLTTVDDLVAAWSEHGS